MNRRFRPAAAAASIAALVAVLAGTTPSPATGTGEVLAGSRAAVTAPLAAASLAEQPRAVEPEDRYALAGGCYAMSDASRGAFVRRVPSTFEANSTAADAEPFHLQATDLGRYLLFGAASDFLAAGELPADAPVIAAARASERADWAIDGDAATGFTLALPSHGRALFATPPGRLVLVAPQHASRFRFTLTEGCAAWPEVETNVTGTPAGGASPTAETKGLLEAHMHMMAFEFIGGRVRCARPWHPYGVTAALVDCPDHHGNGAGAVLENVLSKGTPFGTHDPVGWPTFKDWPAPHSLTHEQSYYKWVERAWRGGLRTFVNLLVDNTALCQVYPLKKNSCNEMDGVRLQAERLHQLQDYIDAQSGGPGEGWFRIVKDPIEARRVINEGKLAVVMGIEVSVLFDCGETLDVPSCTADQIDERLDEVYDMGVRQMELVNKLDNALSGVTGDNGTTGLVVNIGNRQLTGHWWDMQTCVEDAGHETHSHDKLQPNAHDDAVAHFPAPEEERDALAGAVLQLFAETRGLVAPVYPRGPHCNARGLTDLGRHLLDRMVEKGMIFDPDHMSAKAQKQALAHLAAKGYSGVISSHSWSAESTTAEIYRLGGVVYPHAGQTTSFLASWQKAKADALANAPAFAYFGFGYGADINGFSRQGAPRRPAEANDVDYPFTGPLGDVVIDKQVSGERVYDINVDGVSHYGLYPDWMRDLQVLAGDRAAELTADMLRGPEAYLQMWERANGATPNACVTSQARFDVDDIHGIIGQGVETVLRVLGQPAEREGSHFEFCDGDATLRVTFTRAGTAGLVERFPGRPLRTRVATAAPAAHVDTRGAPHTHAPVTTALDSTPASNERVPAGSTALLGMVALIGLTGLVTIRRRSAA